MTREAGPGLMICTALKGRGGKGVAVGVSVVGKTVAVNAGVGGRGEAVASTGEGRAEGRVIVSVGEGKIGLGAGVVMPIASMVKAMLVGMR
jgi:hypothetical protein